MTSRPVAFRSLVLLCVLAALPVAAQAPGSRGSTRFASRAELVAALAQNERAVASTAYSERTRERARTAGAAIQRRLRDGDFRVGDRILFRLDSPELTRTDTLSVSDSLTVAVTGIRVVRLAGALRSELEPLMNREVGAVVRDARVTAQPLLRIAVFGQVRSPGYLAVTASTFVDQLLTLAGGPTADAATDELKWMRGDTVLYKGAEVLRAIARGNTLDALEIEEGDALVVPQRDPPWDRAATLQIVTLLMAPLLALVIAR